MSGRRRIPIVNKAARLYKGVRYDSGIEAIRAHELDLLQAGGTIRLWYRQLLFDLPDPVHRRKLDFCVQDQDGTLFIEEIKGGYALKSGHIGDATRRLIREWRAHGIMPLKLMCRVKSAWQTEWVIPE